MVEQDTVKLLRECDAGSKMAVTSIDEVLHKVKDEGMKSLLKESKDHHAKLGNEIHSLLNLHETEKKDPSPIAKGMSWMKTNMKMSMDADDSVVADLITDGCNMGVKSLHRYKNQYPNADGTSKGICDRLISIEEKLGKDLQKYL